MIPVPVAVTLNDAAEPEQRVCEATGCAVIDAGALIVRVTWSDPVEQLPVGVFVVTVKTAVPLLTEGV